MGFSSEYWHYFHYLDSRGYLIFCCHGVAKSPRLSIVDCVVRLNTPKSQIIFSTPNDRVLLAGFCFSANYLSFFNGAHRTSYAYLYTLLDASSGEKSPCARQHLSIYNTTTIARLIFTSSLTNEYAPIFLLLSGLPTSSGLDRTDSITYGVILP